MHTQVEYSNVGCIPAITTSRVLWQIVFRPRLFFTCTRVPGWGSRRQRCGGAFLQWARIFKEQVWEDVLWRHNTGTKLKKVYSAMKQRWRSRREWNEMEMIDESWEGREVDVDSTQDLSHPVSTVMSYRATNCSMDHFSETKKHDSALPTVFPQLRVSEMQTNHSAV